MLRLAFIACLAASAPAAELLVENFGGTSGGFSGRKPSVNLLSSASWNAGPIFQAGGSVADGNNTDQGAYLDLGAGFSFERNSTYTLTLTYSGLSNAILFAGFSSDGSNPGSQAQVQGTNFAMRVREQTSTPGTGLWSYNGSSTYTAGTTSSPAGGGSSTLTIITNHLTDATASVDGSNPSTVNLGGSYRYLYLGYEDPTSGESHVTLESVVLSGPAPAPPLPEVAMMPASGLLRPGDAVTLDVPTEGLVVRYTLDGSDPTGVSEVYVGPLMLDSSCELRARAFSGDVAGPVSSGWFSTVPALRPNVVLIIGEKIGAGDLSCYGSVGNLTPALDRLAGEGMRFTGLCAVGPGETSSPYALLTGRVSRRGDLADTIAPGLAGMDRREWTLAESFRKAGYDTAFIGAWQLGTASGSKAGDQGFAMFHGFPWSVNLMPAPALMEGDVVIGAFPQDPYDAIASRAESYLSSRGDDPFFLVVNVPSSSVAGTSLLGPVGDRTEAFDAAAGRVIGKLDELGLAENTLVLFLSASTAERSSLGPSLGSNGQFRDGDGTTWDGGLMLPAIARWPGVIPAGSLNLASIWLPDLCPTLATIGRSWFPVDRPYDGIARPEIILGARRRIAGDNAIFHHRNSGGTRLIPAMRSGVWKLHVSSNNLDPENPSPGTMPLLYQTGVDPSERINLATARTDRVAVMQDSLNSHVASFSAAIPQLPPSSSPFLSEVDATFSVKDGMSLTYRRPTLSLDDRYVLEFSYNLSEWWAEPSLEWVDAVSAHADNSETVVLKIPFDHPRFSASRAFVRLRADHP